MGRHPGHHAAGAPAGVPLRPGPARHAAAAVPSVSRRAHAAGAHHRVQGGGPMTRYQLEHAIRAACDVSGDTEVWVFGSQAILGEHPDAPAGLRRSVEVDLAPRNFPERVDEIDGVLGELSLFHETHEFYVH